MKLDITQPFAKYRLGRLIIQTYKTEIYEAEAKDGTRVFIKIHYNAAFLDVEKTCALNEAALLDKLSSKQFPKVLESGTVTRSEGTYTYLCFKYFEYQTMREYCSDRGFDEETALIIARDILQALGELKETTNGGGHYNICPDTVLLPKDRTERQEVLVVDLEHASEPCNGSADFFSSDIDKFFRAPETLLGRYSSASDVYSVGMLLHYMLRKCYPYDFEESMDAGMIADFVKKHKPTIECMSDGVAQIISNAINRNAVKRYKNVNEFDRAIKEYMETECEKYHEQTNENEDKEEEKNKSKGPKLNVGMTVTQGDGLQAVAGMAELKHRLHRDFVDVIKHRELARKFSIQSPNMLFFGPPGTGKTYLSKRLGEETGMPVCYIKPSDLGSIWIHGSQNLIKELFEKAEEKAKKNKVGCLILIDEFDAFVCKRDGSDNEHMANEVAEWLTQLNDCVSKNIFVIGTTNCIQRIDPAVLRHGRIDQIVYIGLPDKECRQQLFEYELNSRPHEDDIDVEKLADITDGFTSSDISYIVKETATNAFEESVKNEESDIVKISETMLENVIKQTRPSVTKQEIKMFEQQRDEFLQTKNNERRAIGFYA